LFITPLDLNTLLCIGA